MTANLVSVPKEYFNTPRFSENKKRCIKIANEIIRAISETPKPKTVAEYINYKTA